MQIQNDSPDRIRPANYTCKVPTEARCWTINNNVQFIRSIGDTRTVGLFLESNAGTLKPIFERNSEQFASPFINIVHKDDIGALVLVTT